ncbi:MAG: hypothetical protein D6704_05215 [Nitrospirae bacterium]|nr:MAG: hypothetical protein D6704_05215 [Nitrospirota bacterium]
MMLLLLIRVSMAILMGGVLCLSTPACSILETASAPAWLHGASPRYPAARYLLGVGEASSLDVAERRAYAAIAKIFQATVQAQSQDRESYQLREGDGQKQTVRQMAVEQMTRVTTEKVLENVQILDRWHDPRRQVYYALAGLDRQQAEQMLLQRIGDHDRTVQAAVHAARNSRDPLEQIKQLRRAMITLKMRNAANMDLQVVRQSGRGVASPYRLSELAGELEALLQRHILIGVVVAGDQAEAVRAAILEGLKTRGLPVTLAVSPPVSPNRPNGSGEPVSSPREFLLLQGMVRLWKSDVPDPLFRYVRWCGTFRLVEPARGRVVGLTSQMGKEGHITYQAAMTRASAAMQRVLAEKVTNTLLQVLYAEQDAVSSHREPTEACPAAAE